MGLFKWITGLVSENFSEVNVLPKPKNSWNLQESTFAELLIQIEWALAIFNQIWDFWNAS